MRKCNYCRKIRQIEGASLLYSQNIVCISNFFPLKNCKIFSQINIDTDEKVQSAKYPFVSLHLLFGVDNETNENYRGIFSFSPLRKTEMENKVAIEKP